jgi:uncharacterized protein (TIGR03492 family)
MRLLCISNGHGEDTIAVRILQALQQQDDRLELAALPIVGEGNAYRRCGIAIAGVAKPMPSGGFIYMDGRQFARDLRQGLLQLTWAQLQTVRQWAKQGGSILAVGDIVPLLFAWWSGAPYLFVGTAKSEYHLRDEQGVLPRSTWFDRLESSLSSVYLPWERSLMRHHRCKGVFPRDSLTAARLKRFNVPAFDLGNPMMDGLEPTGVDFGGVDFDSSLSLTLALLPGSRMPEAYANWQTILQAVDKLLSAFPDRHLLFLAAIVPSLAIDPLQAVLEDEGWSRAAIGSPGDPVLLRVEKANASVILTSAFSDCLHQADLAIAMAGTATEQFVGLGKPAIVLPGEGPQFTPSFAEAQTRLLGISTILVETPAQVTETLRSLLEDAPRLQRIQQNGRHRMGEVGAAQRIAECIKTTMDTDRKV